MEGPQGSAYREGSFHIRIQIPDRYPLHPPVVTFKTPIYHPNIDEGGRICLDILNLPPKGAWQPSLNISTVLLSIGLLLSEPNPDDGLVHEASREYKYNRQTFDQKARFWTEKYAKATAIHGVVESNALPINNSLPPVAQPSMEKAAVKALEVSQVDNNNKPCLYRNVQEPSQSVFINRNGEEYAAKSRGYRKKRLSLSMTNNNLGSSVKHDQQEQTQEEECKENQGVKGHATKLSLSLSRRQEDRFMKHSQQRQAQAGQFIANQMQVVLNSKDGKVEVPTRQADMTGELQLDSNVDEKGKQICSMIIVSDSESEEEDIRPTAKLRLSLNRSGPR
ncbi:unnamed protein product [Victoria cruziana]